MSLAEASRYCLGTFPCERLLKLHATGICLLGAGTILLLLRFHRQRSWIKTSARISGYGPPPVRRRYFHVPIQDQYGLNETEINHFPVVTFRTVEGAPVSVCTEGFEFVSVPFGEKFNIFYNPNDPDDICNARLILRCPIEFTVLSIGLAFAMMGFFGRFL